MRGSIGNSFIAHIESVFHNVIASTNPAIYWLMSCPRRCFDAMVYPITSRARTSEEVTLNEGEPLPLINASCTCDGVWVIQSP